MREHGPALRIAIAGNPNCGKTALFNAFTGIRQRTGNWPGVTVERKEGGFTLDGRAVRVVDLPGIYSLDTGSLDERIAADFLLSGEADLVVDVVDAANLERNLFLTVQLLEIGTPVVVALNMMDVARRRGLHIDAKRLAEQLGCPVVPIVAVSGEGREELAARMAGVAWHGERAGFALAHAEIIEQALVDLDADLGNVDPAIRRWQGLKLLEGDPTAEASVPGDVRERVERERQRIENRGGDDAEMLIADTRFGHAHAIARAVLRSDHAVRTTLTDRVDRVVLGRWSGIPVFLAAMYVMFLFTINVGGAFIDVFDGVAGALLVDGLGAALDSAGTPAWLRVLLADGVGGGVQVVATFIPVIVALYLFLSVLEDSGYMARAAFVMDRFMRSIGLPGKAFVPLIVGFGCNVPAVMATRTLEDERERKLTILMNPFMSCGARLPVYALFAAAFFPANGQNVVFALYLIGIAVAVLTGLVMQRTLLGGESTGFMMELPPYHLPTVRGVLLRTYDRARLFVREAGKVIVVMVIALTFLNSIGTDGSFGNEDSERSVLSAAGRALTPAFAPLGIREDNWPAVVGVFSGVLAKEVVVGTLDNLYSRLASDGAAPDAAGDFELGAALRAALATVPENFAAVVETFSDPLGMDVGAIEERGAAAASQGVNAGVFGAMAARFDGRAGAFAYLLFVLLYFPCVATLGVIRRETGTAWMVFVAAWTTGVAYAVSVAYYQASTFDRHPLQSSAWIGGLVLLAVGVVAGLRWWARRASAARPAVAGAGA